MKGKALKDYFNLFKPICYALFKVLCIVSSKDPSEKLPKYAEDDYEEKYRGVNVAKLPETLYTNAKFLEPSAYVLASTSKWSLEKRGNYVKIFWNGEPWERYFEGKCNHRE